jgi:hypothetical protein
MQGKRHLHRVKLTNASSINLSVYSTSAMQYLFTFDDTDIRQLSLQCVLFQKRKTVDWLPLCRGKQLRTPSSPSISGPYTTS